MNPQTNNRRIRPITLLTLILLPLLLFWLFQSANLSVASSVVNPELISAESACTRFDLEEGRNADTGAGVAGRYEMREVGTGRVLATWDAAADWVDSGWIYDINTSVASSSWVEVFFYPAGKSIATRLEILNPAPGTSFGWVADGMCHAVELQFPEAGVTQAIVSSAGESSDNAAVVITNSGGIISVEQAEAGNVEGEAIVEVPTEIAVAIASPTPTSIPTAVADTSAPTTSSPPTPTPTPGPWLSYINDFRGAAGLPLLTEERSYTDGSLWHSSYMVLNDEPIAHSEDPNNPLFDASGDSAARKGNIFATTQTEGRYNWAINFWFSAPFHSVAMLDPRLETVGYGDFVEDVGTFKMAAVAEVRSGVGEVPSSVTYPIFFPGDGSQTWVTRLSMDEWPNPYGNCPGYQRPSGPALILQLGPGDVTPQISNAAFVSNGQHLDICVFDETSYENRNSEYEQNLGRTILDARDAVVIIPRQQLIVGQTYEVYVTANGETYSWRFEVIKPPQLP